MRGDLQCGMFGFSWSSLDGASWSDRIWLLSDQLSPVSSTENAFFGPANPVGTIPRVKEDLSVKNTDAMSFKLVSCHLLF